MSTLTYKDLLEQIDTLQVEEKLRLAAYLLEGARRGLAQDKPDRKWADVCGLYPYPMLGEDAQTWVTRTRRDGDEQRQVQWKDRE
jgi:hypothetical protein